MGATPIDPTPPETPKPASGTEYMVLELDPGSDNASRAWIETGTTTATLRPEAIKQVVGKREGIFKAVALRSWKGATATNVLKVEQVRTEDVPDL